MTTIKAVLKIRLRNEEEVFLFSEYEHQKKLRLLILNLEKNEAFSGHATDTDLRAQAAGIRITYSEFVRKMTKALLQNNSDSGEFIYILERSSEAFIFKWKSVDSDETVINLGNLKLEEIDYKFAIANILQSLSLEILSLNERVQSLNTSLQEGENKKTEAVNLLALATDAKENLEREMYAKFILVLNEKKRKIRELQLNKKSYNHPSGNNRGKNSENKKSYHQYSDSSDEIDGNLEVTSKPGPSTSKRSSMLFLDDVEQDVPIKQSKMRNRKTGNVVKPAFENLKNTAKPEKRFFQGIENEEDLLSHM